MRNLSDAGAEFNHEELNSLSERIKKKLETLEDPRSRQQAEWALLYATLGIPVFPVKTDGKKPCIKGWPSEATTDPGIIARWFCDHDQFRGAMIGCPAGAMGGLADPGLILVDIDVKNGAKGEETLAQIERELGLKISDLTVLIARTPSGGWHYWLRWLKGVEIKNRGGKDGLGEGIDIRGCGANGVPRGYGILPPSKNVKSGSCRWEDGKIVALGLEIAKEPPIPLLWRLVFNLKERKQLAKTGVRGPEEMGCKPPEWRDAYERQMHTAWTASLPTEALDVHGLLVGDYRDRFDQLSRKGDHRRTGEALGDVRGLPQRADGDFGVVDPRASERRADRGAGR